MGFLFNGALNTFYLRLYGVGHMVNDHSESEKEKKSAAATLATRVILCAPSQTR